MSFKRRTYGKPSLRVSMRVVKIAIHVVSLKSKVGLVKPSGSLSIVKKR